MEGGEAAQIPLDGQPFDIDLHPSTPVVAAGIITGQVELFRYGDDTPPRQLLSFTAHTESCRALRFLDEGRLLLSCSADKSILCTDATTGHKVARLENAHGAAINRMTALTETTLATGDDEGMIKIWDTRAQDCVALFDVHEDFVADFEYVAASHHLLTASGDGTLSVCNLRKNKLEARSENAEDELLSVVTVKQGRKIVCGSQGGVLSIYSWGAWNDCSDRFPGHPASVDALVRLDEDTLITGSSDGLLRIVSILPNKMLGVLGEHADYPIERLAFSHDRRTLVSASHDNTLKLWDTAYLLEEDDEDPEGGDRQPEAGPQAMEEDAAGPSAQAAVVGDPKGKAKVDEVAERDSDEDSDGPSARKGKKKGQRKKGGKKAKDNSFFADL